MKSILLGLTLSLVPVATSAAEARPELKTDLDKASYAVGMDIGRSFKQRGVELSLEALVQGLRDTLTEAKPQLTEAQAREAIQGLQKEMASKQESRKRDLATKNQKEGETFLAANQKKEGVKTRPSGLQYEVVTAGNGPTPKTGDVVKVHYRGTLLDGTEFDSSYARNEPVTFPVEGVIPGWVEALQLMPVGSKWKLFIPAALGYGAEGAGNTIGPNATLTFEVELLGIEEAPAK